uniref:Uncharacterized protein n=1 Tax=Prymnesium polylepis TaxID=72548 RepID=A0A7S4N4I3_9EUKA
MLRCCLRKGMLPDADEARPAESAVREAKPGRCRVCRHWHPSRQQINKCLASHGVKLAPAKPGQDARRRRSGKRAAARAARAFDDLAPDADRRVAQGSSAAPPAASPAARQQDANAPQRNNAASQHRTFVRSGYVPVPRAHRDTAWEGVAPAGR